MRNGLLILFVALLCGCSRPARPPDVIVYLVDTLRPDHLGAYGYSRATSPNLDELAKDAVVFTNAYTPAGWTKPATASLLTGLLPRRHGAITHSDRLPAHVQTAGELLKERGYRTAGFVTNPNVIALWGFDQGMSEFRDLRVQDHPARANEVVRIVLDWLARAGTEPVFVYVHTIEPHSPNNPPEPFRSMWPRRTHEKAGKTSRIVPTTSADVVHDITAAYDGEIAFSDSAFGEFIRGLKRLGRYDDSLIVYLSDHGEELQDHGRGGHGRTLYEEVTRIPLVMKFPHGKSAGKRIVERVSLLDVLPVILRAAGRPPPEGLDGIDLTPIVEGSEMPDRNLLLDLEVQGRSAELNVLQGVISGKMKFLKRLEPRPTTELFDLVADPREQTNRATSDAEGAALLSQLLDGMIAATQGGIHLRLVNEGDGTERSFEGRLRTTGRFVDAVPWQFEPEDRLSVSADAHAIEFAVHSANRDNLPRHVPRRIVDEDGITVRVDPPDAKVVLDALDARGFAAARLFAGANRSEAGGLPLEISPNDPRLAAENLSALLPTSVEKSIEAPGGAYVVVVPYAARETAKPDAETSERLRALGYVQ